MSESEKQKITFNTLIEDPHYKQAVRRLLKRGRVTVDAENYLQAIEILEGTGIVVHGRGALILRLKAAGKDWPNAMVESALIGRRDGIYFTCEEIPGLRPQELADILVPTGLSLVQIQSIFQNIHLPPPTGREMPAAEALRGVLHSRMGLCLAIVSAVATGVTLILHDSAYFLEAAGLSACAWATTVALMFSLRRKLKRYDS